MMWMRYGKSNRLRLLKQVIEAENDYKQDGTPKLRHKSHYETLNPMKSYDAYNRNAGHRDISWMSHRKTQYKK